jgi:hypothetical protein
MFHFNSAKCFKLYLKITYTQLCLTQNAALNIGDMSPCTVTLFCAGYGAKSANLLTSDMDSDNQKGCCGNTGHVKKTQNQAIHSRLCVQICVTTTLKPKQSKRPSPAHLLATNQMMAARLGGPRLLYVSDGIGSRGFECFCLYLPQAIHTNSC